KTIYSTTTKEERRGLTSVMEKIRQKLLPLIGGLLIALASPAHSVENPVLPLQQAVQTALKDSPALAAAKATVESALAQQLILLGTYDTSLSAAISRIDAKTPPAVFFLTPRTITDSASIGLAKRFATGTNAIAQSSVSKELDNVDSAFTLNPRVRSNLNLSLTQSLLKGFIGRPDRAALRESEFTVRMARADLDRAAELLAQQVSAAYWTLWLGRRNKKVLEDSQAEAREFLETTRKLAKRYEAEKDDLLRAEASLLSKELEVLEADEAILDRQEKLRILLAKPSLDAALEDPAPPGDIPELDEALAQAQLARRDLAARRSAAKRDKLHLESLRGLGLPELDLSGSLGWSGLKDRNTESLKQLGRAGFRTWSIGLDLKYAFGARTDKGERRAAAASRMLSDARTRELRLEIERQVKTALARLRLAKSRVEITRRLEKMQEEALKISRKKYRQARISSRDRLLASDTALTARGARIRAEADGAVAQADQKASVGGLLAWLGITR
ncbi:MAG: TolC family protein, partial [Elusimicrobiota bacterium]